MHHHLSVVTGDPLAIMDVGDPLAMLEIDDPLTILEVDLRLEGVVQCTCRLDRLAQYMRWLIAVGFNVPDLANLPGLSEDAKREELDFAAKVYSQGRRTQLILKQQLELKRAARARRLAEAEGVQAATEREAAARKLSMSLLRRRELGEARSAVSSRSHQYAHASSLGEYRTSADSADFCIQLLPPPNLGSDPAHTLFQAVGRLEPGTTKEGV